MRLYDVYRYDELVARVRILERGRIEWAYRQQRGNWQGFWWGNDTRRMIEDMILDFPQRQELSMSDFTIRRWK